MEVSDILKQKEWEIEIKRKRRNNGIRVGDLEAKKVKMKF